MKIALGVGSACFVAGAIGAGFGGPESDARAIAAAAGTLFEAAPFVLAAWVAARAAPRLPRRVRRFAPWLGLAGCGCAGGALPGALALPAVALCAIAFGPLVTAARTLAALAIVRIRHSTHESGGDRLAWDTADPFATLAALGASAFVAALAIDVLGASAGRIPNVAGFVLGLVLGALAPCATAGVAISAGLTPLVPWVAAGVLATTGLPAPYARYRPRQHSEGERAEPERCARGAVFLLAIALLALAIRGPSGLVNPRLLIPIACGGLAAFAIALDGSLRTRLAYAWLVPALMLGCAIAPQSGPPPRAHATTLDDAFPGELVTFTGVATTSASRTTLSRMVITCCRIDAVPIAARLDRLLPVRDGSWMRARGTLEREADGTLALHPDDVRRIPAPNDPFLYR